MNKFSRNQATMPRIASGAERKNRRRDHETFCSVHRGSAFGLAARGADDKHDDVPAEHDVDVDHDKDNHDEASRDEESSPRRSLWLPSASHEASEDGQEDDHDQEVLNWGPGAAARQPHRTVPGARARQAS